MENSIPLSVTDMRFPITPRLTCIVEELVKPRITDKSIMVSR